MSSTNTRTITTATNAAAASKATTTSGWYAAPRIDAVCDGLTHYIHSISIPAAIEAMTWSAHSVQGCSPPPPGLPIIWRRALARTRGASTEMACIGSSGQRIRRDSSPRSSSGGRAPALTRRVRARGMAMRTNAISATAHLAGCPVSTST